MAQHRQQGGFQSLFSGPSSLALAVMTLMCAAASTTAQQQQQPPPLPLPTLPLPQAQPTTTTTTTPTPAMPSVPAACPPAMTTLSPCLSYLFGNSSAPPTECCAQITAMFQSQAPCLCAAMLSGPVQQLGSTLAQVLPTSCDLPGDACSATSAAPAGPVTPASGTTPAAAAAPAAQPNGVDDPTATAGGAGIKSVPGLVHSAAAAAGSSTSGVSAAAALFVSLLVVYLL